jgi:Pol polyprotein, beta-barrel domain
VPVGCMFTMLNIQVAGHDGVTTYHLDSRASSHYTPCREDLQDYIPFITPCTITTVKGQVQAIGAKTLQYAIQQKDGSEAFGELQDMSWVPGIAERLLSVCQLAQSRYTAAFKQSSCELCRPGGNAVDILVVEQVYLVQL